MSTITPRSAQGTSTVSTALSQDQENVVGAALTKSGLVEKKAGSSRRARSDLEIIGAILRATSRNGGMSMTAMRQNAGLSQTTTVKYVRFMLERRLLSVEIPLGRAPPTKIFRPTELGYDFLLRQREISALLDLDERDLFSFWD